ncbi:hypothetical protein B0T25DRAFT_561954 [Lasiosphaeria hispida]|uniref:Uncharacterized protein n=1 Tax=Lasiosphaeria hispida TaxID=260671 RepID=A0AAJ0HU24_9PEZI|nr:hypothetical protein B0T25DRAFT_561954 [Lasiosphaeria hispida]
MALTIKHLNDDASFLLTLEPLVSKSTPGPPPKPYRILLDPWITGPSKVFHSKISIATPRDPACVSSLLELPEPDLVIISQDKTDHCNEATLKQLPPTGTNTIILAEPASARVIRGWKYFDRDRVLTIPRWEDPRITGRQSVVRIPLPPFLGGEPGEITVAFIPQRRDIAGLHAAIAITYRPPLPPPFPLYPARGVHGLLTPPATPKSYGSQPHLRATYAEAGMGPSVSGPVSGLMPPTPTSPIFPASPGHASLRSVRSAMSLSTTRQSCYSTASQAALDRPLSVIFSPHGISYSSLHGYVTSHLISEAALPLTALLHCFDSVSNPWWLGGNILLGAPAGAETARKLGARAWFSAHDGDKKVKGVATNFLRTRRWRAEEVLGHLNSTDELGAIDMPSSPARSTLSRTSGKSQSATEVVALTAGEEVVLTNEGMWHVDSRAPDPSYKASPFTSGSHEGGSFAPNSYKISSPYTDLSTNYSTVTEHGGAGCQARKPAAVC